MPALQNQERLLIEAGESESPKRDNDAILQSRKARHEYGGEVRRVDLVRPLIGHIAGLGTRIHAIKRYDGISAPRAIDQHIQTFGSHEPTRAGGNHGAKSHQWVIEGLNMLVNGSWRTNTI